MRFGAAALITVLASGCAIQAPPYQPSIDNVETLKKSQTRGVALGAFTVQANATGGASISLRGSGMSSPVGGDYAAYLAEALKKELTLAGKLAPASTIEVSGVLIKNDISAGGISTNSGEIEARFIVKNQGQVRYDAVKRTEMSWDSSFVGAIAIPKAQQQYPLIVQQLLSGLMSDLQFQAAIR
ncbi:MAG: hypothetical protein HY021_11170 [Burkholderiales bacterium]|nr:hypothetical protein [Burkholderiales bacterium]